jgi:hypothetical protein
MSKQGGIFTEDFREKVVIGFREINKYYSDHQQFLILHIFIFLGLIILNVAYIQFSLLGMQHYAEYWAEQSPNIPVTASAVYYFWLATGILWRAIIMVYGLVFVVGLVISRVMTEADREIIERSKEEVRKPISFEDL